MPPALISQYSRGIMAEVGEAVIKLTLKTEDLNKKTTKATKSLASKLDGGLSKWTVAVGNLVASGISKAVNVISNSLEGAITRVDTLQNANKMFEAMGYSADSTAESMDFLKGYLDGLPTSLDSAIGGVQQLSASFGGIEIGTQAFKAMNDAGLAFGATSDQISNAITQLSQTDLTGPLDAETWNSLRDAGFSPVFSAMAREAGMTVDDLKEDFGARGTKTVQDFLNMLIKLDNEGSGSMQSLNEMAKLNTNGIGTAMKNVGSRASEAIRQVIESIGSENIANAINAFSSKFKEVAGKVVSAITWIKDNIDWLGPVIAGIATAFLVFNTIIKGVSTAVAIFNAVLTANPIVLIVSAVVGLVTAIVLLWNNCEGFRNFVTGLFSEIGKFFSWIGSKIGEVSQNVFAFFVGIGQKVQEVVGAIAGFFGQVIGIVGQVINVISAPFRFIWNIISSLFIAIVAILAMAGEWIYNTVLAPIINFVVNTSIAIGNAVFGAFENIKNFLVSVVTWLYNNIISPIANFFKGAFDTIGQAVAAVGDRISQVFEGVKNFISGIVNNIKSFFAGLWAGIETGVNAIKSVFQRVFDTIAGIIKAPINGIINAINGVIGKINQLKVPDWVPGIGGASPNLGTIPTLAAGGFASSATTAIIGEAGDEAVLPLRQNTHNWSGLLADTLLDEIELREGSGGLGERPIVVNNYINNEMDADDIGRRIMTSIRRAA